MVVIIFNCWGQKPFLFFSFRNIKGIACYNEVVSLLCLTIRKIIKIFLFALIILIFLMVRLQIFVTWTLVCSVLAMWELKITSSSLPLLCVRQRGPLTLDPVTLSSLMVARIPYASRVPCELWGMTSFKANDQSVRFISQWGRSIFISSSVLPSLSFIRFFDVFYFDDILFYFLMSFLTGTLLPFFPFLSFFSRDKEGSRRLIDNCFSCSLFVITLINFIPPCFFLHFRISFVRRNYSRGKKNLMRLAYLLSFYSSSCFLINLYSLG